MNGISRRGSCFHFIEKTPRGREGSQNEIIAHFPLHRVRLQKRDPNFGPFLTFFQILNTVTDKLLQIVWSFWLCKNIFKKSPWGASTGAQSRDTSLFKNFLPLPRGRPHPLFDSRNGFSSTFLVHKSVWKKIPSTSLAFRAGRDQEVSSIVGRCPFYEVIALCLASGKVNWQGHLLPLWLWCNIISWGK
jgi:hypothetical protein